MKKTGKLILNQETLRNLTREELRQVQGGFFTQIPQCLTGTSCPECPSPPLAIQPMEDK